MGKARLIGVGIVVFALGGGGALFPIEEKFSDFGLGRSGLVTIDCGTAFSDDVRVSGDSSISIFDPVFVEGDNGDESATTFCDRKRSSNRLIAILGLVGGAVLFLAGLFWPTAPRARERPHFVPPPQRGPAASTGPTGNAWWSSSVESPLPDAAPLPHRDGGPLTDPSLPAAPAAPIPDSVVGSLPSTPVSGRFAPSVDPTPAAAPAPIPDEVVGEYRSPDGDAVGSDETVSLKQIERSELSDGQVLLADHVSVVGRSPSRPASHPVAVLVTVDDRTVSKTHAAFGRTGGELWVEDLHSRNGLVVIRENGVREPSLPGESTPLAVGDSVRLGVETTMTVFGPSRADEPTERRHQ